MFVIFSTSVTILYFLFVTIILSFHLLNSEHKYLRCVVNNSTTGHSSVVWASQSVTMSLPIGQSIKINNNNNNNNKNKKQNNKTKNKNKKERKK